MKTKIAFILIFIGTLTAQSPFGTNLGSFNNVIIYSNGNVNYNSSEYNLGEGINTGLKWQCVEFVNRYYYRNYALNLKSTGIYGNANHYFANASAAGLTAYQNGSTVLPQVGDILCSNGGQYGHIAIIKEVGADFIKVAQQNWSNTTNDNGFTLTLNRNGNTFAVGNFSASYPVAGWIRKMSATVGCTFVVNNNEIGEWIFWKDQPNLYTIGISITNLQPGSNWALYTVRNSTILEPVALNRPEINFTNPFNISSTSSLYPNGGSYKLRLTPQGQPNTIWAESAPFYISSLPAINLTTNPQSILRVGQQATINWSITGGVPELPYGGWTGNVRLQWYQTGEPKINLVTEPGIPISQSSYSFTVPSSIPNCNIPGSNFAIAAVNIGQGTVPEGKIYGFSNVFSILNNDLIYNISPSTLSFSNVPINQTKDMQIIISNESGSAGNFTGTISNPAVPFSIVSGGGSFNLAPGQIRNVIVRYSPTQQTTSNSEITITHNGQNSPKTIPLSGTGIASTAPFIVSSSVFMGKADPQAVFADIDNDNDLDLIVIGGNNPSAPSYYVNNNGNFTAGSLSFPQDIYYSLTTGDADNDGDVDVLITGDVGSTKLGLNFNNGAFFNYNNNFPGVDNGVAKFVDYDNDGDLDIFISGNGSAGAITKLFKKTGTTYSEVAIAVPPFTKCSADFGDFDRDGDQDLVISGNTNGATKTMVFRNNQGVFSLLPTTIIGVENGSVCWGDYDSDGDLDLLLTGYTAAGPEFWYAGVYKNQNNVFTDIVASLPGLENGNGVWSDFNNDGYLDILITGYSPAGGEITRMYLNANSNDVFMELVFPFPVFQTSAVAIGDVDGDSDIDVFLCGQLASSQFSAKLLINNTTTSNNPPSVPDGLISSVNQQTVNLQWNSSNDDKTPAQGLSYNVRVGTSVNPDLVFSSSAASSGFNKQVKWGNTNGRKSLTLYQLPGQLLRWSVQAIDNGYRSSAFSPYAEFSVSVPVELTAFAVEDMGKYLSIHWKTASETNNKEFVVQRKSANAELWSDIAVINGAGTSTSDNFYTFKDYAGLQGEIQYRIKQNDYSGQSSTSGIITIFVKREQKTSVGEVFPNPANNEIFIPLFTPRPGEVQAELYNSTGKLILTEKKFIQTEGDYTLRLFTGSLTSGIFLLRITINGIAYMKKLSLVF